MSSTHTVMTHELFHSIDSSDLSSLSSQDKFQYHLWKLYITMSKSPDIDFHQYLNDSLLSFESRGSPVDYSALPPPHPHGIAAQNLLTSESTSVSTSESTSESTSVSISESTSESTSPVVSDSLQLIIDKNPKELSDDDFTSLKEFYTHNNHLWNMKSLHKSCKVTGLQYKIKMKLKELSTDSPKESSPKKSSPKKSSPKKSSPKKSSQDSDIVAARETYFKLFGKKAGRMKLENILKKIAEAQDTPSDTSADTPADTPADTSADNTADTQDPDATQDVYPDDLEPDDHDYSKYVHEGVEYLMDKSTDQLIGPDNKPWANVEEDGSVSFLSQEFISMHQADPDYEPPDCDDDTEVEDNDC